MCKVRFYLVCSLRLKIATGCRISDVSWRKINSARESNNNPKKTLKPKIYLKEKDRKTVKDNEIFKLYLHKRIFLCESYNISLKQIIYFVFKMKNALCVNVSDLKGGRNRCNNTTCMNAIPFNSDNLKL